MTGDVGEFWNDVHQARREAGLPSRRKNKDYARSPTKRELRVFAAYGLQQKAEWHWQRRLDGDILDYWPSKDKWQWRTGIHTGTWTELAQLITTHKGYPCL